MYIYIYICIYLYIYISMFTYLCVCMCVSHMIESCHICPELVMRVLLFPCMTDCEAILVIHEWIMSRVNASFCTGEVMRHVPSIHMWHIMSHVSLDMTHHFVSCHTVTWLITSHTWHSQDLSRKLIDLEIQIFSVWSPPWVGTAAIHSMRSASHARWRIYKWHDSIVCTMTHSHVTWRIHMWHDPFHIQILRSE